MRLAFKHDSCTFTRVDGEIEAFRYQVYTPHLVEKGVACLQWKYKYLLTRT